MLLRSIGVAMAGVILQVAVAPTVVVTVTRLSSAWAGVQLIEYCHDDPGDSPVVTS
ncbi:MAG: hypothetical protein JWN95_2258 [Frankiales bacterium]|nr:hypothetical protein [Frankiales bacterium]